MGCPIWEARLVTAPQSGKTLTSPIGSIEHSVRIRENDSRRVALCKHPSHAWADDLLDLFLF